jgi:AraC-like DNA-binding protein
MVSIGIDNVKFQRIARQYRHRWSIAICGIDLVGEVHFGKLPMDDSPAHVAIRAKALSEATRFGEPTILFAPEKHLVWAVPLNHNSKCTGGLIAISAESDVFPDASGQAAINTRTAIADLRELAETENVTNGALLELRRVHHQRERHRAEAIHNLKLLPAEDIRKMYLRDEPDLFAAIRSDNRTKAREILNRILAAIHFHAAERIDLIKSFLMELVVSMSRSAVEAGGNPEELFGTNFQYLLELAQIRKQQDLAHWVHDILERIMDTIRAQSSRPSHASIARDALAYINHNYMNPITRDDASEAVDASPSHFSRLLKTQLGRSFTDILNQIRVNHAAEKLIHTDKPLQLIAMETGFQDQSYFTKVFRKYIKSTPRQYRKQHEA